ncbi:MAG TPA: response regulator [Thermodesulfovibrionales bacterium]|nr:response regulator [Thermodesulfovibrionales bacterium]
MKRKKILTAAGLRAFIEHEKSVLRRSDYRIFTAASCEEALKIHKAEKVDLIILDIDMPGMTGDKLCSLIKDDKNLGKAYVVLACSDDKSEINRCTQSGADFCITRPIDADLLLDRISEVLIIRARESNRVPLRITVVGSAGKTFFCYAHDLSASGILIETERILHKGESVGCLFCLQDSREILIDGEVARIKIRSNDIYQYGIKFSHLNAKSRSAINALLHRQT